MEEALKWYKKMGAPSDQSALLELLREVQRENGGAIPKGVVPALAVGLSVKESYLIAVIRRFPSLRISDVHTLELCAGPNCGKAVALAADAEKLCAQRNVKLSYTGCMRMCGKGPNMKLDGKLYHKADPEMLKRLLEEL
jgi:NADH:ubiquinone oxidoreductase subunit E